MKKSSIKLIIIELILISLLILNTYIFKIIQEYAIPIILIITLLISIILLGYEKENHVYKKDIILNILIYVLGYQVFIYIMGIFLGFLKTGYNLELINIIKNIVPIIVIIISSEILRYVINSKGKKNKLIIFLSFIIFVLIDLFLNIHLYNLKVNKEIFELIALVLLPSISKNILLTYISLKFGYTSNIIYRLIMELTNYMVPIIPNLNLYVQSILLLIFPVFIFFNTYERYKDVKDKAKKTSVINKVFTIIFATFVFLFVCLTSGVFKWFILAIGSESMSPYINKGDFIIVDKINHIEKLKKDDILVYYYDKTVMVHRIIRIENINNELYFKTKGDSNEFEDAWYVSKDDIIGKVMLKIPLLGYPTIWFNESLNGGS